MAQNFQENVWSQYKCKAYKQYMYSIISIELCWNVTLCAPTSRNYPAPSSDHSLLTLNLPFNVILSEVWGCFRTDVWSGNAALLKRLMKIHSNPLILIMALIKDYIILRYVSKVINVRYVVTEEKNKSLRGLNAHLNLMNWHLTQAPSDGTLWVCHQLEKLWKPYCWTLLKPY